METVWRYVLAAGVAACFLFSGPVEAQATRSVPPLLNRDVGFATQALKKMQFDVRVEEQESTQPPGTVIDMRPRPDERAAPGSVVILVVAVPPKRDSVVTAVPNVVGRPFPEARQLLQSAKLNAEHAGTLQSDRPEGTVVSQRPPAGDKVPADRRVQLFTAAPQLNPDVVGRSRENAQLILQRAKLIPRIKETPTPDAAPGTVLAQTPGPRERIRGDRSIDLVVAVPVPAVPARIPNLVDRPYDEAKSVLEKMGLTPRLGEKRLALKPEGTVLAHVPAAGAPAPGDKVVTVHVAVTQVPNLIGQTESDARAILGKLKLTTVLGTPIISGRPEGTIDAQEPSAGQPAPQSRQVTVRLAEARRIVVPAVVVPAVTDLPVKEADKTLRSGQLIPRIGGNVPSDKPANTVVAQNPVAGARVQPDTQVELILARPVIVGSGTLTPPPTPENGAGQDNPTKPKPDPGLKHLLEVPDVVKKTYEKAAAELKSVGLKAIEAEWRDSNEPSGIVLEQQPPAGKRVVRDSEVRLTVTRFVPPTPTPLTPEPTPHPDRVTLTVSGMAALFLAAVSVIAWKIHKGRVPEHRGPRMGDKRQDSSQRAGGTIKAVVQPNPGKSTVSVNTHGHEGINWAVGIRTVTDPGRQTTEPPQPGIAMEERNG